jgi:carbamoyl-phosphate synthase large subunit
LYVLPEREEIAQEFGSVSDSSFVYIRNGAAIVYKKKILILTRGLEASPIHEVLIDKALMGWKEYEWNY